MRRMIPQKLIDAVKALAPNVEELLELASSQSALSSLAEKSTELLSIEDAISIGEDGVSIDDDVAISGDLTANSIIENMDGYSYSLGTKENITQTNFYVGAVKNGNKLTLVVAGQLLRTGDVVGDNKGLGVFTIPKSVADKLIPHTIGGLTSVLRTTSLSFANTGYSLSNTLSVGVYKASDTTISISVYGVSSLALNAERDFSFEITFLLSDNLAGE